MPNIQEQIEKLRKRLESILHVQDLIPNAQEQIEALKKELAEKEALLIQTQGGAFVAGDVSTGGGDFTGRDKITHAGNTTNIQNVFAPVYTAIQQAALPPQEKEDITAEVKEIETAIVKGEVDEPWLARKLRALKKMAPAIAEVALAALGGPGAAAGAIVKQVAEKVKSEG